MTGAPTAERLAILDSLRRSRSVVIDEGKRINEAAWVAKSAGSPEDAAVLAAANEILVATVLGLSELIAGEAPS